MNQQRFTALRAELLTHGCGQCPLRGRSKGARERARPAPLREREWMEGRGERCGMRNAPRLGRLFSGAAPSVGLSLPFASAFAIGCPADGLLAAF